jgi:hypothetical protein
MPSAGIIPETLVPWMPSLARGFGLLSNTKIPAAVPSADQFMPVTLAGCDSTRDLASIVSPLRAGELPGRRLYRRNKTTWSQRWRVRRALDSNAT